jgi:hypothetical protein
MNMDISTRAAEAITTMAAWDWAGLRLRVPVRASSVECLEEGRDRRLPPPPPRLTNIMACTDTDTHMDTTDTGMGITVQAAPLDPIISQVNMARDPVASIMGPRAAVQEVLGWRRYWVELQRE